MRKPRIYETVRGNIEVECFHDSQVSECFQIWCKNHFNISDESSLAFLMVGNSDWNLYFDSNDEMVRLACEVDKTLNQNEVKFPLNLTEFYNKINNL